MKQVEMFNGYILCKKVAQDDRKTASGIILAESKQNESYYTVVSAPETVNDTNIQRTRHCIVAEGDTVMVIDAPIRSMQMELATYGKGEYHLFNEFQIVAVVDNDDNPL